MSLQWLPRGCCAGYPRWQTVQDGQDCAWWSLYAPAGNSCLLRLSSGMEEMVWEQYSVTLQRDTKMGFGIAVSGGRDNPNVDNGETSIIVSDVLQGGPADGLLFENDRVIQVNSIPMDNVPHSFAVQSLRKCGKVAKITVKRPRKAAVHSQKQPSSPGAESRAYTPSNHYYDADNDNSWYRDQDREHISESKAYLDPEYGGGRDTNQRGKSRGRSQERSSPSPDRPRRDGSRGRALDSSADRQRYHSRGRSPGEGSQPSRELEPLDKPVNVLLVKNRASEEYGLRLGSQIFIKQMTSTGLAAKDGNLQEGDIILKVNVHTHTHTGSNTGWVIFGNAAGTELCH
ncbi:hypothetical protein KUCAC02_034762 [Chaenocephalus aceratus]|nr:hypothetical protein KUCAC02_034762 [Chaenocephalus aceratus]